MYIGACEINPAELNAGHRKDMPAHAEPNLSEHRKPRYNLVLHRLMKELRLNISDLFQLDPQGADRPKDLVAVTEYVLKHYGFLPKPIAVTLDGNEVVISYPEEPDEKTREAARLIERAIKRATEGNYKKAIGIYKRVLELQPSFHSARRDLAMAYVELGDIENAKNHLIEVLRLDPKDAWSWVVLGNLYIREKADTDTGEKFLRKALEIQPNDAWALNSLAAIYQKKGQTDEALKYFERALEVRPDFANPYYGKATALAEANRTEEATDSLKQLFGRAKMQDARSQPVYDGARHLFAKLERDLAQRHHSEAFKCIQDYKAQMESLSGFPVTIEEADLKNMLGATIQMAWKHGRNYHVIKTRRGYDPELLAHLEAHELTHLKLESEARRIGKNRFFATSAQSREAAIRAVGGDIRKLEKEGYSEKSITDVTLSLVAGLTGFLFNCPLDMIIERYIRNSLSVLEPAQFLSLRDMAFETWKTNSNPDIRRVTPRRIVQASLALNGAWSLFLDYLFDGATDFASLYRNFDTFPLSQRLFSRWLERSESLEPGDEYDLVDEFAEMIGLRGWYEWKADLGDQEVTETSPEEGTTNLPLLREKHPAAVFYFLDAFKRFDALQPEEIRNVAFEIALLGCKGLDYGDSEKKYELRSIPNEKFSGLHLMCLMFAGFKRVAPEQDVGMNLEDPFLSALQLYKQEQQEPE
jgi:tetratricopeptide (TPR) repeat protein